jgi:hypothetical protein
VVGLSGQGKRVRNEKGDEGSVPWRKIQEHEGAPVRLNACRQFGMVVLFEPVDL